MIDLTLLEPLQIIERLTIVTPLGVRFLDEVTGKYIGDGLIVTAYPPDNPARRTSGFVNRSSTYVLSNLPGLHEAEIGSGDQEFWDNLPVKRRFVIEVVDAERRFQPFTFSTDAPVRGLLEWAGLPGDSPPLAVPGVPLFSSPNRSVPASLAVLRAELHEWREGSDHIGGPAAWAVLEARIDGRVTARGFADEQGRIALIFPYPEPLIDGLGSPPDVSRLSPPGPTGQSLRGQEWPIELAAYYGRLRPVPPTFNARPIPDLSDVFMQPPAELYADSERQTPLTVARLRFGQELTVRSRDFTKETIDGDPISALFIIPAGSPP